MTVTTGSLSDSLDLAQAGVVKGGGTGWFDIVSRHTHHTDKDADKGDQLVARHDRVMEETSGQLVSAHHDSIGPSAEEQTTISGSPIAVQKSDAGDVSAMRTRQDLADFFGGDLHDSGHRHDAECGGEARTPSAVKTKVLPSPVSTAAASPQVVATETTPGHHAQASPQTTLSSALVRHSPYGDDRTAPQTDIVPNESGTTEQDEAPQSTAYSSALMQALSLREGAAVLSTSLQSTDAAPPQPATDMYDDAMRTLVAKQHWVTLEKARQDELAQARLVRDCPFRPCLSPYAARLHRPAALRPERRSAAEVMRREQELARRRREEVLRELQDCTFRPLTLRTVRQAGPGPAKSRAQSRRGGATASEDVFNALYKEAEERQYFDTVVRPQVVRELQQHILFKGSAAPALPVEKIHNVVNRLFANCKVDNTPCSHAADEQSGDSDGDGVRRRSRHHHGHEAGVQPSFRPQLSEGTARLMAAKVRTGERDRDTIRQLYPPATADSLSPAAVREAVRLERERQARIAAAATRAKEQRLLRRTHAKTVLVAKFAALARHVAAEQKAPYRSQARCPVPNLARATLDVLPAEEAEAVLAAFRAFADRLPEAIDGNEFATVVMQYLARKATTRLRNTRRRDAEEEHDDGDSGAEEALFSHPLLMRPPPPGHQSQQPGTAESRSNSAAAVEAVGRRGDQQQKSRSVPRVKPDPDELQRRRARREAEREEWRQATLRRRAIESGACLTEEHTFRPAPARLIPYECRPDVVIPIRLTRTEELRRSRLAAPGMALTARQPVTAKSATTTTFDSLAARSQPATTDVVVATTPRTARSLFPSDAPSSSPATLDDGTQRHGIEHRQQQQQHSNQVDTNDEFASTRARALDTSGGVAMFQGRPSPAPAATTATTIAPAVVTTERATESAYKGESGEKAVQESATQQPPASSAQATRPCSSATYQSLRKGGLSRLSRDFISERAAFGDDMALAQFGRELLLKQLREYHRRGNGTR